MQLATPELKALVTSLILKLREQDCVDKEEWSLSQELNALPVFTSWGSYYFLETTYSVINTGESTNELAFEKSDFTLLRAIVYGSNRWPELSNFIPARPTQAYDCAMCNGNGNRRDPSSNSSSVCHICAGLGWHVEWA
jgi:hypothetical protein